MMMTLRADVEGAKMERGERRPCNYAGTRGAVTFSQLPMRTIPIANVDENNCRGDFQAGAA